MQGKAKTIALVVLLLVLAAITAVVYWDDVFPAKPPTGLAPGSADETAPGAPARPSNRPEGPEEVPPGRGGSMSG
ncbi:MAG TPA: hypothetical protein PKE29_14145, partial [Phycisphaerales bacterium]|nr:hypothetical protein [Phycisphaerales bacterium]